jgi:hypothetical protein
VSETVAQIGVAPVPEQRRVKCIDLLERMLAEAKSGAGFETVFILATFPDSHQFRTAWPGGLSTYDVIARLEHLKHELLSDVRASAEPA